MFDTGAVLLEVFLFDFSSDLYGATLDVAFIGWIRHELKFDNRPLSAIFLRVGYDLDGAWRTAATS